MNNCCASSNIRCENWLLPRSPRENLLRSSGHRLRRPPGHRSCIMGNPTHRWQPFRVMLALFVGIVCGCDSDNRTISTSSETETPPAVEMSTVVDLGTLGGSSSRANAINTHGVIVGESGTSDGGPIQAFVWKEGQIRPLPLPAGSVSSSAWDINDSGDILGSITRASATG